ncbi:MAG: class I SAM-dependent DNA methyltransferase [Paludibacteraceae bacterium]|nr:class I SAM-dependent DNA methyltransferase [Paludibacteraceae bacterium]
MNKTHQDQAALDFQQRWTNRGYEKGESQQFWLDLLSNVFGIQDIGNFITFEGQVKLSHTSFIDGYIPSTKVLIEQKGSHIDLSKPIPQSDGSLLTPFQQAKRYAAELPYSQRPRWIVVCNFRSWYVYDTEHPNGEPQVILLEDFHKEYHRLTFLVQTGNTHLNREMDMSVRAGEIIGVIYDRLLAQYLDPTSPETLHSLNMLCVRLVFCLYAEDAGIFGKKQQFGDYIKDTPAPQLRRALLNLFEVLDTPLNERDPYLEPELAAFPYVNGGLFTIQDKSIPQFTDELRDLLLRKASDDFDWSEISPTIFGAIFESTLNPETRRSGGMHYTSIENIHKVIDPLFLNDLRAELDTILAISQEKRRNQALRDYQQHLASLRFLDPACGSGNFLTETFLSLRRLENECLKALLNDQSALDFFDDRIFVNIHQFYGIEINDFAATVAKTALWIAESQMVNETAKILARDIDFLPLKSYSNIIEGNALTTDWNTVCPASQLSYIIGNPPFVGARLMTQEQKNDLTPLFAGCKNIGNLDYVGGWYMKAAQMMQTNSTIRTALVSTNSIAQGEQPAILWTPLLQMGMHIDFAHRTFRWDSEASIKAHVHCVIIGFSKTVTKQKYIFESEQAQAVKNINPYLIGASDVIVGSRNKPLHDVPEIGIGNKPIDDSNYLFKPAEKDEFIKKEPQSAAYFRPWYGSDEFINNRPRYCLWLGDCSPAQLRQMPECLKRVENVRNFRLASKSEGTRKLADKPTRFHVENMPESEYIIIPRVSSERRRYIPMGYLSPICLTSDSAHIIPDATLYHFGILTSNVHMAWMRVVCGRLEMRYRYSKDIVYNNFPWPAITPEQEAEISRTAQAILDARNLYPDCSLADLYDEVTMPVELRRAHQANDRAVMRAYGLPVTTSESDTVAHLFKLYEQLTNK